MATIHRGSVSSSTVPRATLLVAIASAAVLTVTACAVADEPQQAPTTSADAPSGGAPSSAPEPHESELPAGYDTPPDTPVVPDGELTADEVTALLRVPATAPIAADSCAADAVDAELWGFDAAAGSRYSTLRVTNTSDAPCTIAGYPGIGARGAWGNPFLIIAEQRPIDEADGSPVTLAPGGAASAPISWTGSLAGAHDEWISLLAVQLAAGQEPLRVNPTISAESMAGGDGGTPHDAEMDVGMLTDVRIGAFTAV